MRASSSWLERPLKQFHSDPALLRNTRSGADRVTRDRCKTHPKGWSCWSPYPAPSKDTPWFPSPRSKGFSLEGVSLEGSRVAWID